MKREHEASHAACACPSELGGEGMHMAAGPSAAAAGKWLLFRLKSGK